jgi:hypothetical protein
MENVIFTNPITGKPAQMPVAMIGAYVPHAEHLHLEEAAKIATYCDQDAATNLMLSIPTEYQAEPA